MLKRFTIFIIATVITFGAIAFIPAQATYAQTPTPAPAPSPTPTPTPDPTDTTDDTTTATEENEEVACGGESGVAFALGWVICPIMHLIITATEFIQNNIIVPFLSVSPLTTDEDNAIYSLWQNIRNIANILFIIVFFIVIFSQATSIGISNYGIKRLLPRLALVAIGANLSYFIAAFIIDAFNIFGAGISSLVMSAIPENPTGVTSGADVNAGNTLLTIGVGLGLLMTPAGGAILQWLASIISMGFLILLVAVVVLVLRQMIIILLVVISPLAFVSYLLPNTERYFEKWRSMLLQLLMMYPLIILLFAVGKIVSALITSGSFILASGETSQGTADAIKVAMGFFASTIPLVALPATFAAANSLIGRISSAVQQRGQGVSGAATGAIGSRLSPHARNLQNKIAQSKGGSFIGGIARYKAGQGMRRKAKEGFRERELAKAEEDYIASHAQKSKSFRKAAGLGERGAERVEARAIATQEKRQLEELDDSMALLRRVLKEKNIDAKTFAGGKLADYIKTGKDDGPYSYREIFQQNPSLMNAALNSAASQGEVGTIEAARGSRQLANGQIIDQQKLDNIIRINDGKMKEKGGYHLATNFNLAAGRSDLANTFAPDPTLAANLANARNELNNARSAFEAARTGGDQAAIQQAQANLTAAQTNFNNLNAPIKNADNEMMIERLKAMAQTGSKSIAGMKAGVLFSSANALKDNPQIIEALRNEVYDDGTTALQSLQRRMQEIMDNANTRDSSEASGAINSMNELLRGSLGNQGNTTPPNPNLNNNPNPDNRTGGGGTTINIRRDSQGRIDNAYNEQGEPLFKDNNNNNP